MFWCLTNEKSNFAIVVARYEISNEIYNKILVILRYYQLKSYTLFVFSNLVPRVCWLSDKVEGVVLHVKKQACSGNKVMYLVTAWKLNCGH